MGESWSTCDYCGDAGSDYRDNQRCENGHWFCCDCVDTVNEYAEEELTAEYKGKFPSESKLEIAERVSEALQCGLSAKSCPECEYEQYRKKRESDKQEELKNWVAVPVSTFKELYLAFYKSKNEGYPLDSHDITRQELDCEAQVSVFHEALLKLLEK